MASAKKRPGEPGGKAGAGVDQRFQQAAELAGVPVYVIARAVTAYRRERGLAQRGRPRADVDMVEARRLREDGLSLGEVAERLEVPKSTLADRLKEISTPAPGGRKVRKVFRTGA